MPIRGRFSHVAVPAFGNTLLIVGGYRGNALGDLGAYTVPLAIAKSLVSPITFCATDVERGNSSKNNILSNTWLYIVNRIHIFHFLWDLLWTY